MPGDLQRSATRVLSMLTNSTQFIELATSQGVSGITIQPYTGQFTDLVTYVTTERGTVRGR